MSGGIDSTYVLWKLLTETDDEVTAVYFDFWNVSIDMKTQIDPNKKYMMNVLADRLKAIRNFNYIHHVAKESEVIPQLEHKLLFAIKYAAPFINNGTYDRLVTGAAYEDKALKIVPHLDREVTEYAEKRLIRLFNRGQYWNPLVDDSWHTHYSRDIALRNLPADILECALLMSCHNPRYDETVAIKGHKCNDCGRCLINQTSQVMIDEGKTSAEILEWKRVKTYEYGANGLAAQVSTWIKTELGFEGAPTKEEVIESNRINKFFHIRNLKNEGIWKGLIEPIEGYQIDV